MLKNLIFTRSLTSLICENKYNNFYIMYNEPKKILNKKERINNIYPDLGSMCSKCKGCGWLTNNKNNKNGLNFGYDICKICRGTGYI